MSDSAPTPSSSFEDESTSDSSPSPPPTEDSKASPPPTDSGGSSTPSPPDSEGSGATPSEAPPPPEPSPSPPSSSSESPPNGGNSNSSPPTSPPLPSPKSEGSLPPPAPQPPSAPPTSLGQSSPSPPPQASSPPPPHDESGSQAKESPAEDSTPPPPPPANQSVVIIPVPIATTPSQTLSPPSVIMAPPSPDGAVQYTLLPGSPAVQEGAPSRATTNSPSRSSGAVPTRGGGGSTSTSSRNTDSSYSHNSSPSHASSNTSSIAIIGVAVAGFLVAMFAIILVISRKKKKRVDGLVYHYGPPPPNFSGQADGNYYMQSNQFGGSNPSGTFYPPRTSTGFSSGPYGTDNFGGGYNSGMSPEPPGSKSSFSYEELMDITCGFSRDNLIGEGGFGCVYKGWLSDGRCVAVKQLKAGSGQGEREFQAEVEIISRVHHRHLVSLVGYCIAQSHRMLVYEFVPNGTLEHHLHGKGVHVMDWSNRLKIAIGSARGLAYLHEDCHPRVIHRDIKSANILLDYSFEAQVADFGLAKPSNESHTHVSTRIMGTFGYLAPEYASSGKLTDRSDVFSFGVVLLELISGRKPVDPTQPLGEESLVEWARPVLVQALETGDFDELVDPRLADNYDKGEMFRMVEAAAACVRHSAPKRPRMVQVLRALDDEGSMTDLSNGVKVGQSQVFSSGQHAADMQQFRRMAFAIDEGSGEYEPSGEYRRRGSSAYSAEQRGREAPRRPPADAHRSPDSDLDTRPMNPRQYQSGGFS